MPALSSLRRLLLGSPLPTSAHGEERYSNAEALAILSSDALSSVAYATQEIVLVLGMAGAAALRFTLPLTALIVALMMIVATSYRQTIRAYPKGGGSYRVSQENLGSLAGLVAGASLSIDYVLTVAGRNGSVSCLRCLWWCSNPPTAPWWNRWRGSSSASRPNTARTGTASAWSCCRCS